MTEFVPKIYALGVSYVEFDGATDDDEWVLFEGASGECWTRGPVPEGWAGEQVKLNDRYARLLAESLKDTKEKAK